MQQNRTMFLDYAAARVYVCVSKNTEVLRTEEEEEGEKTRKLLAAPSNSTTPPFGNSPH